MKGIKENIKQYKNKWWSWKGRLHMLYHFTNSIRTSQQCTFNFPLPDFMLLFHILYSLYVIIIKPTIYYYSNFKYSMIHKQICLSAIYIYASISSFKYSSFLCVDLDLHLVSFFFLSKELLWTFFIVQVCCL